MNPTQPTLPIIKPAFVEVPGVKLEACLADLRSKGARAQTMERVENGLWKLRLVWDTPDVKTPEMPNGEAAQATVAKTVKECR
jgi:hypothetical protein